MTTMPFPQDRPSQYGAKNPFDVLGMGGRQIPRQRQGMFANASPIGVISSGPAARSLDNNDQTPPAQGMFAQGPGVPMFNEGAELHGIMEAGARNTEAQKVRRKEQVRNVVGAVSEGLLTYSAGMGNQAAAGILQNNLAMRRDASEAARKQQEAGEESYRKQFDPRSVGSNLIQMQPDGSYATLYNAPEPFEDFASSLGHQPGSEEYEEAVRNYRLGSWSDDAVEAKQGLTGYRYDRMGGLQDRRYDRMGDLQDERLDVTRRGQDISSGDRRRGQDTTRRGQDLRSGDARRGQDLTDKRTRESAGFQGRGGRASAAGSAARAVNPRTGQAIVFKGGVWVDEKSGKPVT